MHISEVASPNFINHYINEILIKENKVGSASIKSQVSALSAYYNWLAHVELCDLHRIFIEPDNKEIADKNTERKEAMKYISTSARFELKKKCKTIRDELFIRMGYEVGLRRKENLGLLLNDFTYNKKRKKGLLSLFEEMKSNEDQEQFEYFLAGTYTKGRKNNAGGVSRIIYFPRSLLARMRDYYLTERDEVMDKANNRAEKNKNMDQSKLSHNTFFVKTDNVEMGQPISAVTASNRFSILAKGIAGIHKDNRYHDLRHTFGTNLFHEELKGESAINVGLNHPAIITVATRLGHQLGNERATYRTTQMYIRMHGDMMKAEFTNDY